MSMKSDDTKLVKVNGVLEIDREKVADLDGQELKRYLDDQMRAMEKRMVAEILKIINPHME